MSSFVTSCHGLLISYNLIDISGMCPFGSSMSDSHVSGVGTYIAKSMRCPSYFVGAKHSSSGAWMPFLPVSPLSPSGPVFPGQ